MNQYETVIIFTPVLSDDDVRRTQDHYKNFLRSNGGEVVAEENWGLKQLAYPIRKKTTGIYYVLEYNAPGELPSKLDVQFNRDETILRYLTIGLDKYAANYNDRKRKGEIGRNSKSHAERARVDGARQVEVENQINTR